MLIMKKKVNIKKKSIHIKQEGMRNKKREVIIITYEK